MGVAYNTSIVTDGLVFHIDAANPRSYSGSGITVNGLAGGIGGTLVNGVGFTTANNGSFIFDGVNDYINVSDGFTRYFSNNDYWTVDLWYRFTSTNEPVLISGGPSIGYYDLFLEIGTNQIYFAAGRGSSSSYIQNNNVFNTLGYNLASKNLNIHFIKNGASTGLVYVNGINIPMSVVGSGLSSMPNITEDMRIGSFRQSGFELTGNISQVKIYNRALSPQEIQQNYAAIRGRYGI